LSHCEHQSEEVPTINEGVTFGIIS
jgi:hypothetical protein